MRTRLLIAFMLMIPVLVRSQHFSVGAKAGANRFISLGSGFAPNDFKPNDGYKTAPTGELFARYNTKGRLGFEAGLNYASMNSTYVRYQTYQWEEVHYQLISYYTINFSAQYDIRCNKWREHKKLGRLSVFVGAGVTGGVAVFKDSYKDYNPYEPTKPVVKGRDSRFGAMLYLSQSCIYRLDKEFSFIFSTDLRSMPWQWNNQGRRNGMSSVQGGLVYHID